MRLRDKETYSAPEQGMIEYGFVDFNGNEWPDLFVDRYNDISKEINRTANREIESGSLVEQERQFLLDQRHRLFIQCLEWF